MRRAEDFLIDYVLGLDVDTDTAPLLVREVLRDHGGNPDVIDSYRQLIHDLRARALEQVRMKGA
jgi:hypothetical protein